MAASLFQFQTENLIVGFALPCYLHCLRLAFAIFSIWNRNYIPCKKRETLACNKRTSTGSINA